MGDKEDQHPSDRTVEKVYSCLRLNLLKSSKTDRRQLGDAQDPVIITCSHFGMRID